MQANNNRYRIDSGLAWIAIHALLVIVAIPYVFSLGNFTLFFIDLIGRIPVAGLALGWFMRSWFSGALPEILATIAITAIQFFEIAPLILSPKASNDKRFGAFVCASIAFLVDAYFCHSFYPFTHGSQVLWGNVGMSLWILFAPTVWAMFRQFAQRVW